MNAEAAASDTRSKLGVDCTIPISPSSTERSAIFDTNWDAATTNRRYRYTFPDIDFAVDVGESPSSNLDPRHRPDCTTRRNRLEIRQFHSASRLT